MANFYLVNTPLINYFFYKAPFIQNGFSLSTYSIQSGGSGYAIGDIIICLGGIYTTPVIFVVNTVSAGVITSVKINNNGVYSTTPTTLTQSYSSGSGVGATFNSLTFISNLLQPPGPNIPLTGGFIFFYEDENRTVQANSYSDVSNPNSPVVNPNPLRMGTSGETPLFYLDDRLYYIVITDNTGDQTNPVQVIEHYNPSDEGGQPSAFNDNFIVNPQFNYPITFYKTTDDVGEVTEPITTVAWAWQFLQDDTTLSENIITFQEIIGLGIEGDPINQIVVSCIDASASDSIKDLLSILGKVDFYNGNFLTFSAQMINLGANTVPVSISLEFYYGTGGSPTQTINLKTFNVGVARQKFNFSFAIPAISGETIGEGNYLAIHIEFPIGLIFSVGITNVMVLPGTLPDAVFVDEAYGFSKAQILGSSTDIDDAGLFQNYSPYYYLDGTIIPYANTGDIILCPTNIPQPFRQKCNGTALLVNGYNDSNIPNQRLYGLIGTEFGGSGDLIVTASNNVVTFTSPAGARQKSTYTAGTTTFIVTNTVAGLKLGFNLVNNFNGTVTGTYTDMFAPVQTAPTFGANINQPFLNSGNGLQTYWGSAGNVINSGNIGFTTIAPGSGSTFASFTMTFNSTFPADYQTKVVAAPGADPLNHQCSSFIEFSTFSSNIRQFSTYAANAVILFSINGVLNPAIGQYQSPPTPPSIFQQISFNGVTSGFGVIVDFLSGSSMAQNIIRFINQVANAFQWTVTLPSAPLASQYFLYSSAATDYYGWFTVNGVGTDPAIGGRTGVMIAILSGQTTEQIADIIAKTINTASFNVPNTSDLPALVGSSKVSWFITL